ncbi:MAG: hypothetical protein ACRETX_15155, partial [Steroidobacteraceae bacterium]
MRRPRYELECTVGDCYEDVVQVGGRRNSLLYAEQRRQHVGVALARRGRATDFADRAQCDDFDRFRLIA